MHSIRKGVNEGFKLVYLFYGRGTLCNYFNDFFFFWKEGLVLLETWTKNDAELQSSGHRKF